MPSPDFQRVEDLFNRAVELPIGQRRSFLESACGSDGDLRNAVEELLRQDSTVAETHSFLVSPLTHVVHNLRPTDSQVVETIIAPKIPGYDILGVLGRGGMGVVFKARQTSLNRIIALKMLQPAGGISADAFARFRSEAELLARIHQPNIVSIYGVGEHEGRPYFTMEFIDGLNLGQFLSGKPQDPTTSARLIETLARAVHAVHQAGVLHRDLKPANVLLQIEGKEALDFEHVIPKITDFGVAKDWTAERHLTQTGMTLGTPSYMAPEQVRNRPADVGPAVDVYSLGAILYEMMTGRPPFDAATPAEIIVELLNDDPLPPPKLRAGLPRDLVTICLKCLEKSPTKRYGSAQELADDLRRFLAKEPIRARPVGWIGHSIRWCRRHPLAAGLATLCGILLIAYAITVTVYDAKLSEALARVESLADQEKHQIIQLNIEMGNHHLETGDTFAAVLRFVEAMEKDPASETELRKRIAAVLRDCPRLMEIRHTNRKVLCAGAVANKIWLATLADNHEIEIRDALTDQAVRPPVKQADNPREGVFSPDGHWLAVISRTGFARLINLESGFVQELRNNNTPVKHIAFHPLSNAVVATHTGSEFETWDLTADTPKPQTTVPKNDFTWQTFIEAQKSIFAGKRSSVESLEKPLLTIHQAAVSPNARHIVTVGNDGAVRLWDLQSGRCVSLMREIDDNYVRAEFSADGRRVLLSDQIGMVRVWDATTGRPTTPIIRHGGSILTAAFNQSGDRVVVVGREGGLQIWDVGNGKESSMWDFRPESRPLQELSALAQILSCRRIDEQNGMTNLKHADCMSIADSIRPTVPAK